MLNAMRMKVMILFSFFIFLKPCTAWKNNSTSKNSGVEASGIFPLEQEQSEGYIVEIIKRRYRHPW